MKYDRITVALVNAVREQQTQIVRQRQEIEMLMKQQEVLDELKSLVCANHPNVSICKSK